jgi:hypothetical protein
VKSGRTRPRVASSTRATRGQTMSHPQNAVVAYFVNLNGSDVDGLAGLFTGDGEFMGDGISTAKGRADIRSLLWPHSVQRSITMITRWTGSNTTGRSLSFGRTLGERLHPTTEAIPRPRTIGPCWCSVRLVTNGTSPNTCTTASELTSAATRLEAQLAGNSCRSLSSRWTNGRRRSVESPGWRSSPLRRMYLFAVFK